MSVEMQYCWGFSLMFLDYVEVRISIFIFWNLKFLLDLIYNQKAQKKIPNHHVFHILIYFCHTYFYEWTKIIKKLISLRIHQLNYYQLISINLKSLIVVIFNFSFIPTVSWLLAIFHSFLWLFLAVTTFFCTLTFHYTWENVTNSSENV